MKERIKKLGFTDKCFIYLGIMKIKIEDDILYYKYIMFNPLTIIVLFLVHIYLYLEPVCHMIKEIFESIACEVVDLFTAICDNQIKFFSNVPNLSKYSRHWSNPREIYSPTEEEIVFNFDED